MNHQTTTPLPIVRSQDAEVLFALLHAYYHCNEETIHDDSFGADMEILCCLVSDDDGRQVRIGFHSDTLWTAGFFRKEAGEYVRQFNNSSSELSLLDLILLIPLFFLIDPE